MSTRRKTVENMHVNVVLRKENATPVRAQKRSINTQREKKRLKG